MKGNRGTLVAGVAVLAALVVHALGQTTAVPRQAPWLEPQNPTRLEWLALTWQANEGDIDFADGGTVNFYLGPDSYRTGVIECDLEYLPNTQAELVQIIEDGIVGRFERQRTVNPWARVKINKRVARR